MATMPIHTGVKYPASSQTGTVVGKVVTSANGTVGLDGAYVAIVNANDVSEEYANTTSDMNGNYNFTGVNVTGSDSSYKIFANKSPYGEGYTSSFGVVANGTSMTAVVIFIAETQPSPTPTPVPSATPTITPTPTPTLTPTPANNPTATPVASSTPPSVTPTPAASSMPTITTSKAPITNTPSAKPTPAISVLAAIVALGMVAYCLRIKR